MTQLELVQREASAMAARMRDRGDFFDAAVVQSLLNLLEAPLQTLDAASTPKEPAKRRGRPRKEEAVEAESTEEDGR